MTELSKKETSEIVTPYAFGVDESLFGTPLGTPFARLIAILIDLFLVALLTSTSGVFLAFVATLVFLRQGQRVKHRQNGYKRQLALRTMAGLFVFVAALTFIEPALVWLGITDDEPEVPTVPVSTGVEVDSGDLSQLFAGAGLAASIIGLEACDSAECVEENAKDIAEAAQSLKFDQAQWQEVAEVIETQSQAHGMSEDEAKQFSRDLADIATTTSQAEEQDSDVTPQQPIHQQDEKAEQSNGINSHEPESPSTSTGFDVSDSVSIAELEKLDDIIEGAIANAGDEHDTPTESARSNKPVYSIVEYVKALIEDLGLGFGWAALYFSVFSAWFKGRTPGKKIMGLRVIQLDGTNMSLWESFNRYGGYGAGIATGMLGFLQIYWDPNRQAIHDKISETLVISTRRPKVTFVAESNDIVNT